jgi:glycerophosphoryl diester phosphodiesterase
MPRIRIMIDAIGHRGASAYEPENTLRSFERAIAMGATSIELDVQVSMDNEIIVMHDSTVDRTTNGTGRVSSMTLEELKELDAGKGECVPTLKDVIDMAYGRAYIQIEIKDIRAEDPVVNMLRGYSLSEFFLISFWHATLLNAKRKLPGLKTGVLLEGLPVDPLSLVRSADADRLAISQRTIDKDAVDVLHAGGKSVSVWVADDISDIEKAISLGVDAIASNRPDVLVNTIRKSGVELSGHGR